MGILLVEVEVEEVVRLLLQQEELVAREGLSQTAPVVLVALPAEQTAAEEAVAVDITIMAVMEVLLLL